MEGKNIMLDYTEVLDILEVKCGCEEFVVASGRDQGIAIYATNSKFRKGRIIAGKCSRMEKDLDALGLAYDGRDHLFVSDCYQGNKCIQMFSFPDGKYLGCLIREGEQGLGLPTFLCWCEAMSSLVIVHWKHAQYQINAISVEHLTAMLTSIQSAGVAPEVNLRTSVQARKRASEKSTLALKPRADVTRSPKQEYQWPHKKGSCLTKILKKEKKELCSCLFCLTFILS